MTEILVEPDTLVIVEDEPSFIIEEGPTTVIVESDETTLIVYDDVVEVLVEFEGPPGPIGPSGPAGDSFDYVQAVPAATWLIYHNLNRRVHVTLFDGLVIVHADVVESTLNLVTVTFPTPFVGSAHIS